MYPYVLYRACGGGGGGDDFHKKFQTKKNFFLFCFI